MSRFEELELFPSAHADLCGTEKEMCLKLLGMPASYTNPSINGVCWVAYTWTLPAFKAQS